jgi:uncharacterized membrane protein
MVRVSAETNATTDSVDSFAMIKRISLWGATLVAIALVALFPKRSPPPPIEEPPRLELPAVDPAPGPPNAERGSPAPPETLAHTDNPRESPAAALRKFERRFMFDCAGEQFFIRIGDSEAALLPGLSLTGHWIALAPAGAEWHGRYASEDIVFRKDGDVATFEIGEQPFTDCAGTRDRAAMAEAIDGVLFQAFGKRPDWTLDITAQDLTLTTERGVRTELPVREPLDNGARFTFRSVLGTQEIVVTVDRIPCYDAAGDETFEHTVAVTFDNAWYYGCGRSIHYR